MLLLIGVTCHAQVTPQYYIERHPNGLLTTVPIVPWGLSTDSSVMQFIFVSDSFNTGKPPYGKVKNIYIRTGPYGDGGPADTALWKQCKATKVRLALDNTPLKNFDTNTRLVQPIPTIAFIDTLTTASTKGGWIRIPVMETANFYIDTTKNLIFEYVIDTGGKRVTYHPMGTTAGCFYFSSYFKWGDTHRYRMASFKSNKIPVNRGIEFADFGFDLYPNPADVSTMQNLTDLRIYPNPSAGRFIISMAAERVVKEAQLTISDMAGRVVWRQQYQNIDDNFYQQIDMSAYPQGIYLAELRADGERLTRKLVVQ